MHPKNSQSGYLMEVPLVMMVSGVLAAVLLPLLPNLIGKFLLVMGALIWIAGCYYMLIIPGRLPGADLRLRFPLNWLVFIGVSGFLALVTGMYVLRG